MNKTTKHLSIVVSIIVAAIAFSAPSKSRSDTICAGIGCGSTSWCEGQGWCWSPDCSSAACGEWGGAEPTDPNYLTGNCSICVPC